MAGKEKAKGKSNTKGRALQQIIVFAQQYRKQHPTVAWKNCIKEASKKYNNLNF